MKYDISLNGVKYTVEIDDKKVTFLDKQTEKSDLLTDIDVPDFDFGEEETALGSVKAALPGTVIAIKVSAGEEVKKGQTLMIIESMKMENAIVAPEDCCVREVLVSVGSYVSKDQKLVSLG